jgi:hypothetical protein
MIPSLRMRKGIGRSLVVVLALLAASTTSTACISGDVDEEKPTETVPAGISPENATFHVTRRDDGAQQALVIRLSSVSLCDRAEVPERHPFVELELVIPADATFAPETCRLDQTFRCRIRLLRTTTPGCASSAGPIAAFGHLQIDEITDDEVFGSFVGTSVDSKIDLHGSFAARRCAGSDSCP